MNGIAMTGMRILATLLAALACALVASAQSADETAKSRHLLPHIADGDGWRSRVLVTNVSSFDEPVQDPVVRSFHPSVRERERGEGVGYDGDLRVAQDGGLSGLEHPQRVGAGVGIRNAGLLGSLWLPRWCLRRKPDRGRRRAWRRCRARRWGRCSSFR